MIPNGAWWPSLVTPPFRRWQGSARVAWQRHVVVRCAGKDEELRSGPGPGPPQDFFLTALEVFDPDERAAFLGLIRGRVVPYPHPGVVVVVHQHGAMPRPGLTGRDGRPGRQPWIARAAIVAARRERHAIRIAGARTGCLLVRRLAHAVDSNRGSWTGLQHRA